jgi:hypothetical protein
MIYAEKGALYVRTLVFVQLQLDRVLGRRRLPK